MCTATSPQKSSHQCFKLFRPRFEANPPSHHRLPGGCRNPSFATQTAGATGNLLHHVGESLPAFCGGKIHERAGEFLGCSAADHYV